MGFVPVKTPTLLKKLLPDFVWEFSVSEKILYLTFDDGPTPEITQWTLNTLNDFNAKATFFCIGNNIEKHAHIFQNILEAGHRIGNHSNTHLKGWNTHVENYVTDINTAQLRIKTELNQATPESRNLNATHLFRPPYGQITPKQGKALKMQGYTVITWSILSFDWEEETQPETCYTNVINNSKPGDIIVFHDSVKASKNLMYALPKVLAHFSGQGYSFKVLPI